MSIKSGKMTALSGVPKPKRNPDGTHSAPFCNLQLNDVVNYAVQLQNNPTVLAEDAANYKDSNYVRSVSNLFWVLAKTTEMPVMQIKQFRISDMEIAFAKLAKEHRDEYKELCKFWGIIPEDHQAKKATNGISPHKHLIRLSRWGYFDLFFPNIEDFVDLVVKKTTTSSATMNKFDIAKYAQIFAQFIVGHSFMPYDLSKCLEVKQELEKQGKKVDQLNLRKKILGMLMPGEKNVCWNAGMLYYFYWNYMRALPDGAINIDAVVYFMELIDYKHKLVIKEFMNMLSDELFDGCSEKTYFKALCLSPILSNLDIRALKEELFPCGIWGSNVSLFMMDISEKERCAYRYAYNRFKKNGFAFGKGVESIKAPYPCSHPYSKKSYTVNGYRYAWSPLAVRVSDENELWMMRIV